MSKLVSLFEDYTRRRLKSMTSLLPACQALFGKSKVTVNDINTQEHWNTGKHTIQVAHHNGDPAKTRFIFGSGHMDHTDNDVIHAKHDQTGANLGAFHVKNTIHVTDGRVVKSHKAIDNTIKAPLLVYK